MFHQSQVPSAVFQQDKYPKEISTCEALLAVIGTLEHGFYILESGPIFISHHTVSESDTSTETCPARFQIPTQSKYITLLDMKIRNQPQSKR